MIRISASASTVRPGSLRPPGSDTYADRAETPAIEWTATVLPGSSQINYGALTISAPHRITNIQVVNRGHRSGPERGARYHPAMLSGVPEVQAARPHGFLIVETTPTCSSCSPSSSARTATDRDGT
jgi:hypothetical protein